MAQPFRVMAQMYVHKSRRRRDLHAFGVEMVLNVRDSPVAEFVCRLAELYHPLKHVLVRIVIAIDGPLRQHLGFGA
jgi:hypothetical protein